MGKPTADERDAWRRETVRRAHQLKDVEEDFDAAMAPTTDRAERQRLMDEMYRFRKAHREEDIRRGTRSSEPGVNVLMHQIMWARWVEAAAAHAKSALVAHDSFEDGRTDILLSELRHSMVTTTASAATIEALYEDVKYLIEVRKQRQVAWRITDGLAIAFGLSARDRQWLGDQLVDLFNRRNETLHGYSEPAPPAAPTGFEDGIGVLEVQRPAGHRGSRSGSESACVRSSSAQTSKQVGGAMGAGAQRVPRAGCCPYPCGS